MNLSARTHHPSYHARTSGTCLVVDSCYLCATTGEYRKSAPQATNRDKLSKQRIEVTGIRSGNEEVLSTHTHYDSN